MPGLMRVAIDAHTVGRRQTGNERYTVELVSALAARDDIELIAYVDRGARWPARHARAPHIVELRTRWPQLRIPFELPIRTRHDRADVLQVSYVAPPVLGVPLVTVVHDVSYEDLPSTFRAATRWRLQLLVRLAIRRSAAVVAVSEFTRRRLIDVYRLPAERVHHVPLGVSDRWRPSSQADRATVLDRHGLTHPFVLAVGTAHPRKNHARLVEAVERVRARLPDLALVVSGPAGEADDELDRAVSARAATGWVHRLGYVDDDELGALYGACAAFAYPSLYEGFGLPVLEALASGATVVASSTTAVGEVAGDACVLVEPRDVSSIADGIQRALFDDQLRTRLSGRRAAHLARFSWDACAAGMVEVYRTALARSRGA